MMLPTSQSRSDEVAKVIASEACGEGEAEMKAVANVIANRVRDARFPDNPGDVVSQPGQFDGFKHKNKDKIYSGCKEYSDYLSRNILTIKDTTNGAIFFRRFGHMGHIYYK